jgi:hypothetical protein
VTQSAGNMKNRSSETIRGNTYGKYDEFRISYNNIYNTKINIDDEWLDWFVGFVEGDGAILGYKNKNNLVIVQKDVKVLNEIKNKLNMGYIKYYYKDNTSSNEIIISKEIKYGRYIINDINNILLMYLIFNGNLKLNKRKIHLKKWYDNLHILKKNLKDLNLNALPLINYNKNKIGLEDAWLSGFTDAEGCFSLRIFKQRGKDYVKSLFILDQKYELEILNEISLLFSDKSLGKLIKTKNGNMYRIEVSCNDINKLIYKKVINYFDNYKLKTTKNISYNIWKEVLYIILVNQPLNEEKILYIRSLRKKNNKYIILNNSIGQAKKS